MTKCFGCLPLVLALVSCGGGSAASLAAPGAQAGEAANAQMVAANTVALVSIEPGGSDFSDLDAFGRAVGERTIVILDEPTHGDGNTFKLKARLVEYLHQRKGFDLLLMESGLFDVTRMRERRAADGRPYAALAPGRMFFMYAKTEDGRRVLDYVDATQKSARPLELGGYDISMGGSASVKELLPRLTAFLAGRNSAILNDADWSTYQAVASQVVALQAAPRPADTALAAFKRVAAKLDAELCGVAGDNANTTQSAGFWCRIVKSVHNGHERLWTPNDTRDIAAGGNVQWLMANAFKGRKLVLWMHSGHAITGLVAPMFGANWRNVGSVLGAAHGDQVYVAHFTAGQGAYNAYGDFGKPNAAPPPVLPQLTNGMLEHYLAKSGKPSFMAYPPDAAGRKLLAGLSVFETELFVVKPSHFGSGYAGVFFVPRTTAIVPDAARYPELP
jgi:erythromycin esterase